MSVRKNAGAVRLALGVAAVALLGTATFVVPKWTDHFASAAWAQEGDGEGGKGKQGDGQGQGGPGEGQGQGGQGSGKGQGGPGEDSDGQGPKAGSGGNEGGKPVWAQEGIPEIELGRLNVARSPSTVLDRAFNEALATITEDMVAFYNLSTEDMIEQLTFYFDSVPYIDSPLQNLALLQEALDGTSALRDMGVTTDADTLIAVFLAVASDKAGDGPNVLVVEAVTTILGHPVTGERAEAIAAEAYAIWVAIVAGHG